VYCLEIEKSLKEFKYTKNIWLVCALTCLELHRLLHQLATQTQKQHHTLAAAATAATAANTAAGADVGISASALPAPAPTLHQLLHGWAAVAQHQTRSPPPEM
jgi:hypothetical protein